MTTYSEAEPQPKAPGPTCCYGNELGDRLFDCLSMIAGVYRKTENKTTHEHVTWSNGLEILFKYHLSNKKSSMSTVFTDMNTDIV